MSNLPHVARVKKLYKLILRLHRSLPGELKELGDIYTRDEFRRHKKCTPHEANIFLDEWTEYFVKVSKQIKPTPQSPSQEVGLSLDPQFLDNMRDEQIMQLYELRKAALKIEGSDEH